MKLWPARTPTLTLGTYGPILGRLTLSPPEVATHKHVMGVTGQGKSKLLASLFVQLLNQGVGVSLVDPHSDLALDVLAMLLDSGFFDDERAYQRLRYIDFTRKDRFLPFNVLRQPYDAHTIARNLVESCKRAWPALSDGAAPQFENIALAGFYVLVENRLPLTAMSRLLTDKSFREGLLANVSDSYVVNFWHARFDQWSKEQAVMIESTLRRVFLLTFSPTLRNSLGQIENALNFRELMDQGTSVIFNLGGLDEDTQRFLGCLLTVGFEVASLSRAEVPESQRPQYHLILDEFSMFSAQSEEALARVLSLARKYGLFLTMAHQTFSQVSERLRGALQNTVDIAFRLGRSDAEWAAPRFGHFDPMLVKHQVPDPLQADRSHPVFFSIQETWEEWTKALEQLKPRDAYVKLGDKSIKIKTLKFPAANCAPHDIKRVTDRYAEQLLVPLQQIAAPEPSSMPSTGQLTFRKVSLKK